MSKIIVYEDEKLLLVSDRFFHDLGKHLYQYSSNAFLPVMYLFGIKGTNYTFVGHVAITGVDWFTLLNDKSVSFLGACITANPDAEETVLFEIVTSALTIEKGPLSSNQTLFTLQPPTEESDEKLTCYTLKDNKLFRQQATILKENEPSPASEAHQDLADDWIN